MARPRTGHEKHATRRVGVRIPADVRGLLEHRAAANGSTITDEVVAALRRDAAAHQSATECGVGKPA